MPGADLMFVGDSIVGNIAVLGATQPDLADQTLVRLLDRGRARVVPRTVGAVCNRALGNARAYLAQLRSRVLELRNTLAPEEAALAIGRITIETCIAHGELATPLERHWHADNLKRIVAARLVPGQRASRESGTTQPHPGVLRHGGFGADRHAGPPGRARRVRRRAVLSRACAAD
ncbi:hypothetical protein LP420_18885 [Massilia sp. B-10]|nr:hypothetical protein LP420_18885 [Massilia sp. B-10]